MSELVAQNGAVDFRANTIVISDPDDVAGEALFGDIHQLRREFLAEQYAASRSVTEGIEVDAIVPYVLIAAVKTPDDAGARLDALQALRTGKVPEIIVPDTVESNGIVLEEFNASAHLTQALASRGMFPHAYAAEQHDVAQAPPTLTDPAKIDAVLGVLAHNLRGR